MLAELLLVLVWVSSLNFRCLTSILFMICKLVNIRVPQFRHRYFHHLESRQYDPFFIDRKPPCWHLFIGTPTVMLDTEMLSLEISLRSRVTSCFRFSVFFPCTNHSSVLSLSANQSKVLSLSTNQHCNHQTIRAHPIRAL